MPRVSQQVAQQTKQRLINTAIQIVIEQGIDGLTFSHLAAEAGTSRSGISVHFKKKQDLLNAIAPLMRAKINAQLDFSSPQDFWASWVYSIENSGEFRNLIEHIGALYNSKVGFDALIDRIQGEHQDCVNIAYQAAGYAAVNIPLYQHHCES